MSGNEDNNKHFFKAVVIGDFGVGKTNLSKNYTKEAFNKIGFYLTKFNIDNKEVTLRLWDTAGQE